MPQLFANDARRKLAADISDTDTTFLLDDGAVFPTANTGVGAATMHSATDWFKAVLQGPDYVEIVYVRTHNLGVTPDQFSNVLRGQEGTTARAWTTDTIIGNRLTAGDMATLSNTAGQAATTAALNAAVADKADKVGYVTATNGMTLSPANVCLVTVTSALTLNLPSAPEINSEIILACSAAQFSAGNVTLARANTSHMINNIAENVTFNFPRNIVTLRYVATNRWALA